MRAVENLSLYAQEGPEREAGTLEVYATEEEYKNSENYREGIEFEPDMSVMRAQVYAENYDKRKERERILAAGDENGPWWYGAMGFGGGLIGSLPDPINLIPFGGGAVTGARLAGMTGKQLLSSSMKKGAIEGAAGNFAASLYAAYDLNPKGEDIGAQEVLTDTMFGAVAGPMFHGVGAFLGRARTRKNIREDMSLVLKSLDEDSPLRAQFSETLDSMQSGDVSAYASGGRVLELLNEDNVVRALREASSPAERMEIARAMELAVADLVDEVPIDVASVMEGAPTLKRIQYQALVDALESGEFTDIDFGTLRPDYKAALNEFRTEEGVMLMEGDNLVIPANVVRKLHNKRMLKDGYSADGIARILLDVFHRDSDFASKTKHPTVRAVVSLRRELADLGFIGVNEKTGETVIKGALKVEKDSLTRKLSLNENHLEGRGRTPHTVDGETPPPAAPRLSALQDGESTTPNISDAERSVNAAGDPRVFRVAESQNIDWRTEMPPDHPPVPEKAELDAAAREGAVDPDGISPEEAELGILADEGKLRPEDIAAIRNLEEDKARLDSEEDASLAIAECVMRVK